MLLAALLLLSLCFVAPARAADFGYPASLAARMMTLMWDGMLWFFTGGGSSPTSEWFDGPAGGGWNTGFDWGTNAFGASPSSEWGQYANAPGWDWGRGGTVPPFGFAPGFSEPFSSADSLDGVWRSPSGEWLMIRGQRFRLREPHSGSVDGLLKIRGDTLLAGIPRLGRVERYRFLRREDLLVLGDAYGRTLLFRRVR